MFRQRKFLTALFSALLLFSLQLHSIFHLHGHQHAENGSSKSCAICVEGLQQKSVEGPQAFSLSVVPQGFLTIQVKPICSLPQYRCFNPMFRGPPAVS